MQKFNCSKTVLATAMTRLQYNNYRHWELPADENGDDPGYLVEALDGGKGNHKDHDGYITWMTAEQFESESMPEHEIELSKSDKNMSFGQAVHYAKQGYRVAREGWNGKGMYAAIMPGFPEGVPANEQTAAVHDIEVGDLIKIRPYWVLKTAQNDVAMWAPSGSDSLAEDWQIFKPAEASTPKERLVIEREELFARVRDLNNMLDKGQPKFIDNFQWQLLNEQKEQMDTYLATLIVREKMWK